MQVELSEKRWKNNLLTVLIALLITILLAVIYLFASDILEFDNWGTLILFEVVEIMIPLVMMAVLYKAFSPEYKGIIISGKIGRGFLLLLPFLVLKRLTMMTITENQLNLLFVLESLRSGICEELIFRGIPYVILMSLWKGKKPIVPFVLISSLVFSSLHLLNIDYNDSLGMVLQLLFTFGMGMLFAGTLVRSRNILALLIGHVGNNLIAFAVNGSAETVTTGNILDYVLNLAFYLMYFIFGLVYMIQAAKEERRNIQKSSEERFIS